MALKIPQATPPVPFSGPLVDVNALRDEILAAVQGNLIHALATALSQITINVPTPSVKVDAPIIQVDAPTLPSFPSIPEPTIELEVALPGMSDLCERMCAVEDQLKVIADLLRQPVTKTVQRDYDQLITTVRETRGA